MTAPYICPGYILGCHLVTLGGAAQEGEQAMTALMPHPPGAEHDPDDRTLHVPAGEYHNDPDEPGGAVDDGGGEHGAHEQAMWHDATNQQLQQLQEAAAAMAQQQQQHAQQHEYPQSSMAPDMHNAGGVSLPKETMSI